MLLVTLGGTVRSNLILVTVPHVNKVEHALSLEVKIPVFLSIRLVFNYHLNCWSINVIRYCNSSLGCVLACVGNHLRCYKQS